MPTKPCPACRRRPCADGRARCVDCMETEIRKINRSTYRAAAKEESGKAEQRIIPFSRLKPDIPDRVLVDWADDEERRSWAKLPDPKTEPPKKNQRKGPKVKKRNQYFPAQG